MTKNFNNKYIQKYIEMRQASEEKKYIKFRDLLDDFYGTDDKIEINLAPWRVEKFLERYKNELANENPAFAARFSSSNNVVYIN